MWPACTIINAVIYPYWNLMSFYFLREFMGIVTILMAVTNENVACRFAHLVVFGDPEVVLTMFQAYVDPQLQFFKIERFGNVIIGSQPEPLQLVGTLVSLSEKVYRH